MGDGTRFGEIEGGMEYLRKRIEELEAKVRALEARPVYVPYYPWWPTPSPYQPIWSNTGTSGG